MPAAQKARPIAVKSDVLSGSLFMIIGGATAAIASSYGLGTLVQVGPGFFPLLLGIAVLGIGGTISLRAIMKGGKAAVALEPVSWRAAGAALRPVAAVTCAVLAFGLIVRPCGLAPAILVLVGISRLAIAGIVARETLVMAIVLTVVPTIIFVYGLGVPIEIWAW